MATKQALTNLIDKVTDLRAANLESIKAMESAVLFIESGYMNSEAKEIVAALKKALKGAYAA